MFPAILLRNPAEPTPAEQAKQAQAWDVVVKVAATRAAEHGFAPKPEEMAEFEACLGDSLREHAQKVAAERTKPGIYASLFKVAGVNTPAVDFAQEARSLVSSPEYANLFA